MKFGIVGFGVVGRHLATDIERAGHESVICDIKYGGGPFGGREDINACDTVFICVGTPQAEDGSCDLSAIEDVFSWLRVPLAIIRSTVKPGTTERLQSQADAPGREWPGRFMKVAFCPEFIGEGINAPYVAMRQPPFLIIGGDREARTAAAVAFSKLYNSECEMVFLEATTAEVAKYFENAFLATKVTLCNEFYDICQQAGANYEAMANAVAHDYRIGRSHLHVYPDKRGWSGRCLPKDLAALVTQFGDTAPLAKAVLGINERHKASSRNHGG